MSISSKVKGLLSLRDKKNVDLARHFEMLPQTMNNKFNRDSWSAKDLIKVAEFCGCRLAFILPDGGTIYLDEKNEQEEKGSDLN